MNADADLTPTGLAQLIVDVLDALNVDKVDLVGVDTGGALSQLLMAWHRDRVGRVVLTGCDAYESFPPRSFKFLVAPLKLPGALFMTAQGARLRVMRKLGTVRPLTHAKVDDAIVKSWTRPLLTRGIRRDLRKVLRRHQGALHARRRRRKRRFPEPRSPRLGRRRPALLTPARRAAAGRSAARPADDPRGLRRFRRVGSAGAARRAHPRARLRAGRLRHHPCATKGFELVTGGRPNVIPSPATADRRMCRLSFR